MAHRPHIPPEKENGGAKAIVPTPPWHGESAQTLSLSGPQLCACNSKSDVSSYLIL